MKTEVSKELTAHVRANFAQLNSLAAILDSSYRSPNPYEVLVTSENALGLMSKLETEIRALCVEARDELARSQQNGNK